ncbi:hypothetical protein GGS23DRAFT_598572 [Durotheca rogersii]|uniref:uncharacterized protein n=1 Tax=Durotheca rogersii TaxID=419775 RepID=UPI00222043B1|nr:uncharacterized protein GGS23DRAFT_598572 [Durotheca rogersii]KAI5861419.1 hypothetical protein GGS23DRAFT_598572 [Durotheca rogersii]
MAYKTVDDDLAYGESYRGGRWDRHPLVAEVDRIDERDRVYNRGPGDRLRETSVGERRERRSPPPRDGDLPIRGKRYYEEPLHIRHSPPPEVGRRLYVDPDLERRRDERRDSPPRRPGTLLRRQSSLDTFDRRPPPRFVNRDEPDPPARYRDYRPEPYDPIPLPRSRALPPPRMYAERDYDEIKISDPGRYGDEEFHNYPGRVLEREIVRSRRRRDSSGSKSKPKDGSVRSRSTSRASSSDSSSSSGGTAITTRSVYPKKGKTRIPARLVSKRALIDLCYPYTEEGNTIVVQLALGQQNIDDLLKHSEEYKRAEQEVTAARSSAGGTVEERRQEVFVIPPPPMPAPPPPPVIHTQAPVVAAPPPAPVEVFKDTTIREASPTRTVRSRRSHSTSTTRGPLIIEPTPREISEEVPIGPLALVSSGDKRRKDREISLEIARLQAERDYLSTELEYHHPHRHHHHHSSSRHRRSHSHSHSRHRSHSSSRSRVGERELVSAERLPTGELVLYEEQVEHIEEPRRGVRIEKDKKGRMSISVPKYR